MEKDESLNEEECQTLEITGESEEEYRVRRAQGMMKRLCKMIDNHNAMVVVGYAPETDNDMPYRAFATAVYNIAQSQTIFSFGVKKVKKQN